MRLFGEKLDTLQSGFGFEIFVLSVLNIEALHPMQRSFLQESYVEDECSFDALVDRFGMRLGFQNVNRIRVCESFLPEQAVELRPATSSALPGAEWLAYRTSARSG